MNCPISTHTVISNNNYLTNSKQKIVASAIVTNITNSTGEQLFDDLKEETVVNSIKKFIANVTSDYLNIVPDGEGFLTKDYKNDNVFKKYYNQYRESGDNVALAFTKAAIRTEFDSAKINNVVNSNNSIDITKGVGKVFSYNKLLSNFSISEELDKKISKIINKYIKSSDETSFDWRDYNSINDAIQAYKTYFLANLKNSDKTTAFESLLDEEDDINEQIIDSLLESEEIQAEDLKLWEKANKDIIKYILTDYYSNNPSAVQQLLNSNGYDLSISQIDNLHPEYKSYLEVLKELRDEYSKNYKQENKLFEVSINQDAKNSTFSIDVLKQFAIKVQNNTNVFNNSVSIHRNLNINEYTISNNTFVSDFLKETSTLTVTDSSLLEQMSEIAENDLIRVKFNDTITTAYVKSVTPINGGIQIEVYQKYNIQVSDSFDLNNNSLNSQYISLSQPLGIGSSVLSAKQKLGASKYAARVKYTTSKMQEFIDSYIEENAEEPEIQRATSLSEVLNNIGFDFIMNQMRNNIQEMANTPNDELVSDLASNLIQTENLDEDSAVKKAKDIVKNRLDGWNEILENWDSISFDAITQYGRKNNIEVVLNDDNTTSAKKKEKQDDSEDTDDSNNFKDKENQEKESWQFDQANAHVFKSISTEMKELLAMFPLLDANGMQVYDDMYEPVNLSENRAYMQLQNLLLPADNIVEMYDILKNNIESHPEYQDLIDFLDKDQEDGGNYQQLFFQLFNAQVQNFINFSISEQETSDAFDEDVKTQVISAIPINGNEGVTNLISDVMSNINNETKLVPNCVYTSNVDSNIENARNERNVAFEITQNADLQSYKGEDFINELAYKDWLEDSANEEDINNLFNAVRAVGFDISLDDFKARLVNYTYSDLPILDIADNLQKIFYNITDKKPLTDKNGGYNSGYIKRLAELLNNSEVTVDRLATVRSDNKTYAQFKKPSYFSNLFKHLTLKNRQKRQEFIEKEFGQYDWFKNKGNKEELVKNINEALTSNSINDDTRFELEALLEAINNNDSEESINESLHLIPNYENLLKIQDYRQDSWNNDIIKEFLEDDDVCKMFSHSIALSFDKDSYEKWTPQQYAKICLTQYFKRKGTSKDNYADFMVPILADATSAEFITLKKRGSVEACIEGLYKVYKQEKERIALVAERQNMRLEAYKKYNEAIDKGKKLLLQGIPEYSCPIANFDVEDTLDYDDKGHIIVTKSKSKQGSKFNFLSFLYNYTDNPLNISKDEFFEIVNRELAKEASGLADKLDIATFEITTGVGTTTGISRSDLIEYCAETMYATAMIEEITITDLAQYKNAIDFQKRYKQVYASTSRMDTKAKYGRENERNIILKDLNLNRLNKDIESIIKKCPYFSAEQKETLLKEFKNVNVSDAQSFRSISSYRAILSMSGQWDDKTFGVLFDKLMGKNKEPVTAEELSLVMQTKKPFVFTSKSVNSKVAGKSPIRVGFQIKNSEFLLLWAHSQMDLLGSDKGGIIKAINQFMEDNNIDVVNFESAIKVGLQGAIDFTKIDFKPDIKNIRKQFPKGEKESEEDYKNRIQEEYNKELIACNKKNYSLALHTLYNATGITKGAKNESYEQKEIRVNNSLNPEVVHTIPYSEYGIITSTPEHYIDHKQRLGTQLLRLITADNIDSKGNPAKFTVAGKEYDSKGMYQYINSLLNAKALNHFKKLQNKLGNNNELEKHLLNQMRNNDRYSDTTIHSVHLNEDGEFDMLGDPVVSSQIESLLNSLIRKEINEINVEGGTCIQVTSAFAHDLKIKWNYIKDSNGNVVDKNIAYLECRLPFHMKELYEKFMDETGMISIKKIEELCDPYTAKKLLRLVGCRIPTESKHSIQHLRVVGFLPQNNGSAIMLPAEITKLAGSDFDVDKMFLYRYSFRIDEETGLPKFVDYRHTSIESMNEAQLNNALIDAIWSVLSSPSSAAQMITPSDFEESKRWGYISYLTNEPMFENEILNQMQVTKATAKEKYNFLSKLSTDSLADILSMTTNRLGLSNQLRFFEANTKGKSLLGIMAVNSVSQAMFQHSNVSIEDKFQFTINGNRFGSFSNPIITYADGTKQLSTKYIQEWLAAAADNTKDPVLSYIGVSHELINAAIAMCRLGYPVKDIALFFNNPIIKKVKEVLAGKTYIDKYVVEKAINDVIGEDSNITNLGKFGKYEVIPSVENLTTEDLLGTDKAEEICNILMKLTIVGEDLNELSSVTRSDSTSGNVSSSMAGNLSKLEKQAFVKDKLDRGYSSLRGAWNMLKNINIPSNLIITDNIKKQLIDLLNTSDLGYVQGQNSLALQSLFTFFYKKLPTFSPMVLDACLNLANTQNSGYLSEKQIKRIVNEYIKSMLYQIPFFGDEVIVNKATGESVLFKTADKIEFFRDNMWDIIIDTKNKYPELTNNKLLQSLKLKVAKEYKEDGKVKKRGYDTVILPDAGNITETDKEAITNAWDELINSPIDDIRKLGMNLIRYSFYRNGLQFSPDGFGHLAPNSRSLIEGYINQLKNCNTNTNNKMSIRQFLTQFVKNNYDILNVGVRDSWKHHRQTGCFYRFGEKNSEIAYLTLVGKYTKEARNNEAYYDTNIGEEMRNGNVLFKFPKLDSFDFRYYDINDNEVFNFSEMSKTNTEALDTYLSSILNLNKDIISKDKDEGVITRIMKEVLSITNKTWC